MRRTAAPLSAAYDPGPRALIRVRGPVRLPAVATVSRLVLARYAEPESGYADVTVMIVCPIEILSPFFSS